MKTRFCSSLGLALGLILIATMSLAGLGLWINTAPAYAAPMMASEDGTRDTITPTTVLNTGITQSLAAASGDGHKFSNTGNEFVLVANSTGSTITMTVVTGATVDDIAIADVDVAVDDGDTALVGPFATSIFNQTSGDDAGKVYLTWDAAVTGTTANSVTLAVYKLP